VVDFKGQTISQAIRSVIPLKRKKNQNTPAIAPAALSLLTPNAKLAVAAA
jgi:hypothetical protein